MGKISQKSLNKKATQFKKGHKPLYRRQLEPNNTPSEAPSIQRIQRLSQQDANEVNFLCKDPDTLRYKLRPVKIKTETSVLSADENIIVGADQLTELIKLVHKRSCKNSQTELKVISRTGLCLSIAVHCKSCHFISSAVEMTATIKKNRGPAAGALNEMVVLPVLKSKVGISDISLILSCLNIRPPSRSLMQTKVNLLSSKAEELNTDQMLTNQMEVKRLMELSGREPAVDVQTDTAFSCRPQGGSEKAQQSFAPLIEHNTAKRRVLSIATANKFCTKHGCDHSDSATCRKSYISDKSISSSERHLMHKNLKKVHSDKILKIQSVTTDASTQLSKALRDYQSENQVPPMKHYLCMVHKLRTLEKKVRQIKLTTKLPRQQTSTVYLQKLAQCVRIRIRMELNNLNITKYDTNDFITKGVLALENIAACLSGRHRSCKLKSKTCIYYLPNVYTTKYLPYGEHLKLNKEDLQKLSDTINSVFDISTLKAVTEMYTTNLCESMHAAVFNYAPKFTCWRRNFNALCHSATHSRTMGRGLSTVLLARAAGIKVHSNSYMFKQLHKMDVDSSKHSQRKKTTAYKQARYFLRKKRSNRALYENSLYACQPSTSTDEHSYGLNR